MTIASAHAVSGHDAAALTPEFVRIKNVDKIYKARAAGPLKTVDSISPDLHGGKFVSIVGPSGCSKTL